MSIEKTNKILLNKCLLSNVYINMFRALLCPSSGEQDCELPHMVFSTGCAGRGRVQQDASCMLWDEKQLYLSAYSSRPAPHHHDQHNQCWIPYEAVHSLVLLMMGIIVPETCWDKRSIINICLVAPCWFSPFTFFSWCTVTWTLNVKKLLQKFLATELVARELNAKCRALRIKKSWHFLYF
jgi:hypothetical protein